MKRILHLLIAVFAIACVFTACSKAEQSQPLDAVADMVGDSAIMRYLSANNITANYDPPSGLYYRVLNPGDGQHYITLTDTPYVIYTRRLITGILVESSKGQVTNFDGRALKDHIPGWQIGLQKISKGGSIEMYIPPSLGFGSQAVYSGGVMIIPPNSVQICQVQLVDFH